MNKIENYLIFAHYHSKGLVRKDILSFLQKGEKFFNKIIFVSTKINKKEIKKIPKKNKIITRKNEGYDFCSYKKGWEYLSKKFGNNLTNKNLFFANVSVVAIPVI